MEEKPVRASDAERDACAARLRRAAVEGRIDLAELDERLAAVYRSRTRLELAALIGDLPALPVERRATPRSRRPGRTRRVVAWSGVGANASLLALWLADVGPLRDVVILGMNQFDLPWPAILLAAWSSAVGVFAWRRRHAQPIRMVSPIT
jgi:Domain of unknown function (DUF1707)